MLALLDYVPGDHQRQITDHILQIDRGNVWSGMGTGKTVATLTALDIAHNILGDDHPTLVLAPLRVARSTWPAEQRKWKHLRNLPVVCAAGTPDERRRALAQDVPVVTINYDNIPWLVEHYGKRWPFRRVVSDESTRLKGFRLRNGGLRAQQLGRVAHTPTRTWVNLTGTPAPNGLVDLWGQNWFCDAGVALGRTFEAFKERWFKPEPRGERTVWVPHEWAQAQIEERLRPITITVVNPLGVDEPIRNVIRVPLPPKALRHYREMEREFFTELAGHEIEAFNSAARSAKCMQIASGAVYTDPDQPGVWAPVHDALLEALDSVVTEAAGMPVLVAYQWKHDLERILKTFPQARHLDDDPRTIDDWNAGRVPMLAAHPASAGHGLNLQDGSNILAFFGVWWDLELHDQIIERIGPTRQKQSGYDRSVYIHYLIAENTMHETALQRIETKRSVQDVLLEAMRRRR